MKVPVQHPVSEIFTRAAAGVPGYPAEPLIGHGYCVLPGPGDAADLMASCTGTHATLWVDHYLWSEYEWGPGNTDELLLLAETVAAAQHGDGEFYFSARGRRLTRVGARIGDATILLGTDADPAQLFSLPFASWESQIA